ncbi:ROK family protein [Mucilaginibacter rubeus]|uniref:ROK family protein n=1 Tax=Mucilaginibacter rubeus TaxID=2027860 RepID=A0AAE6JKT1_9SPHI|nr:ROK family protein [Mucilaginibacter rubeus]QEM07171.1 ROK family protein [Mucilaginibacter rubeus]QTE43680.1 ROK family protein [Mucilaginibacter rubeus]QTE50280.1 ROK family protein [Mucilaginibacter rubeus]QTE55367.1 ROK family protein [Mucilaginibacter rubeus]QTE65173.1 ROK family protein [Mucilaginibacter rubeus]
MSQHSKNNYVISADIGGTHITAAVVDLEKKIIIEDTRTRISVDSQGAATEILENWSSALIQACQKFGSPAHQVALAMPGPFDYKNGISLIKDLHKYEAIYGLNIKSYLSEVLKIEAEDVLFRNDAEAFLQGEVLAGAGTGFRKVLGITLGTGFGSALSFDGITKDLNLGSEPYQDSIADDYFSTRWFLRQYYELTGLSVSGVSGLTSMVKHNPVVTDIFEEFTANLSLFLKHIIRAEKPDVIVIGGNIAKASNLFLNGLIDQLAGYVENVKIRMALLGEDAALMGAAAGFATKAGRGFSFAPVKDTNFNTQS